MAFKQLISWGLSKITTYHMHGHISRPPFTYQWPVTRLKTPSFPFSLLRSSGLLFGILGTCSPHPSACRGRRCQRRRRGEEELRCVSSPCISGPLWRRRWAATCMGWWSRRRGRNRSRNGREREIHHIDLIYFVTPTFLFGFKNTGTYILHSSVVSLYSNAQAVITRWCKLLHTLHLHWLWSQIHGYVWLTLIKYTFRILLL